MAHPGYKNQCKYTTNLEVIHEDAPHGSNTMIIYNQSNQMIAPQDVNSDGSWFWLNTSTQPPHWSELNDDISRCISQQLTPHLQPLHLKPFNLLKSIYTKLIFLNEATDTKHHRISRVQLMNNVATPMALDCDDEIPFVFIPKWQQHQEVFGYPTVHMAHVQLQTKYKQNQTKYQWQRSMKSRAQQILFLNQKIRTMGSSASAAGKWYCFGIGSDPHMWYAFDCSISKRIDEYYCGKLSNSFFLNGNSVCLSIDLPERTYSVDIPYGFASIVNGGTEERFLIIRCEFPCYPDGAKTNFEVSEICWSLLSGLFDHKLENIWNPEIKSTVTAQSEISEWQQSITVLETDESKDNDDDDESKDNDDGDDYLDMIIMMMEANTSPVKRNNVANPQNMNNDKEAHVRSICDSEQKEMDENDNSDEWLTYPIRSEEYDVSDWLNSFAYNRLEIQQLKDQLRSIITEEKITAVKLLEELELNEFIAMTQKQSSAIMTVELAHKLFDYLTYEAYASWEKWYESEVCEETNAFIDRWCKEKKEEFLRINLPESDEDHFDPFCVCVICRNDAMYDI